MWVCMCARACIRIGCECMSGTARAWVYACVYMYMYIRCVAYVFVFSAKLSATDYSNKLLHQYTARVNCPINHIHTPYTHMTLTPNEQIPLLQHSSTKY